MTEDAAFLEALQAVNDASLEADFAWRAYMKSLDLPIGRREHSMLFCKNQFVVAEAKLDAALTRLVGAGWKKPAGLLCTS